MFIVAPHFFHFPQMDSVKKTSRPPLSKLSQAFAMLLPLRATNGIAPVDRIPKIKQSREFKDERSNSGKEEEEQKLQNPKVSREALQYEALAAKLFAGISCVKAAYAQLQFSLSPCDSDGIQKSDRLIVSKLKTLSELKRGYSDEEFDISPETSIMEAESQEQKSLLKIYEITRKKMEHQLNLKLSQLTHLREKLEELNNKNALFEESLNQFHLEGLQPSGGICTSEQFVTVLGNAIKSVRNFVRTMIEEMRSADWDIEAAASAIEPAVIYSKPDHKSFVFESYVSREMFEAFQLPDFSLLDGSLPEKGTLKELFLERFTKLRCVKPKDLLDSEPKSEFAKFCQAKYPRLIHPIMESAFFGDLSQRNAVSLGEFPDSEFFALFAEMAKWIWLLHSLALSFEPSVSIFQVCRGSMFSDVYMENVAEEGSVPVPNSLKNDGPRVVFTVFPGFKLGATIMQCQVYLLDPQPQPSDQPH